MSHDPVSNLRSILGSRTALLGIVAVTVAALASPPVFAAVLGPVDEPPGGVATTESCGSASCDIAIGMPDGITWGFSGLDYDYYTSLFYGPAGAATLGFAADGAINSPDEWMTYAPGHELENLGEGILVFTGQTTFRYRCGTRYTWQTRLIIDFDGDFGSIVPGVSVLRPDLPILVRLDDPGEFSVNLKLQAYWLSSYGWSPAIWLFNELEGCSNEGTRTDVTTSFFYEKDDHPAILDALAAIEAKLDAADDERIDEILARVTTIDGRTSSIDARTSSIEGRTVSIEGQTFSLIDMTQQLEAKLDEANLDGLGEMLEMMLKISAEQALLEGKRVAMIYLPFEYGGLMEHIRGLVEEKIQLVEDSGESSYAAQMYMTRGDNETEFKRYKRAYDQYARAYCEAVKQLGERCPQ